MDMNMIMIVAMVGLACVMFVMTSRKDRKRKQEIQELRENIAVGDHIITIAGEIGKVVCVHKDAVTFECGEDRVRLKVCKWAIQTKGKAAEEQDGAALNN